MGLIETLCQRDGVPVVIGHRGAACVAPENTLASFRTARAHASVVEFDVHATSCGDLVVIHDDRLERTTDGTGLVRSHSLEEIQKVDAGSWFSPEFAGERVPTLRDAVACLLPRCVPLIECKSGAASTYIAQLDALGVSARVLVQSFDWTFVKAMRDLAGGLGLGALGEGPLSPERAREIEALRPDFVGWDKDAVGEEQIELLRSLGLPLFVWTVNSVAEIESFVRLGVDGVISDDPAAVARCIGDGAR